MATGEPGINFGIGDTGVHYDVASGSNSITTSTTDANGNLIWTTTTISTTPPNFLPGGFVPVTTSGTTTTFPNLTPLTGVPDPCESGHHVSEDLIEHADGVIVAYCSNCNTRIVLDRVPGGVSILRVKSILAALMAFGTEDEIIDEAEILRLMKILTDEIAAEDYALEEARELLDVSRKILTKKIERAA